MSPFGAFFFLSALVVRTRSTSSSSTDTVSKYLPEYLVPLNESSSQYEKNKYLLTSKYVIGEEGKGNMIPGEVKIVEFAEESYVFRVYGGPGKASQCGWWWTLNPPKGDVVSFHDHFAVCDAWNDCTNIIRCLVPKGYIAAVGIGQSVDCPSGEHRVPLQNFLQLTGNICAITEINDGHLPCETCSANRFKLETSACDNTETSCIDGHGTSTCANTDMSSIDGHEIGVNHR